MKSKIQSSKQTKENIVTSFWELYKTKPIEKITVKNITDSCGIHRATFYLHFSDVYAVLEQIERRLMQDLCNIKIENTYSEERIVYYVHLIYELFQKERNFLSVLIREQKCSAFAYAYKNKLKEYLQAILQIYPASKNNIIDLAIIDRSLFSIVELFLYLSDDLLLSFDNIVNLLKGYMQNGIAVTLLEESGY